MLCELRKIRKMTQRVKQKVIESGKLNPSELSWSKEEETAGDFSRRQHKPLENLNNTKGNVNPSRTVTINTGDCNSLRAKSKVPMATEEGIAAAKENANRRPTLRDLCLEDKRRVKNLVEEVARLGTEKERLELEMVKERAALQSLLDNLNTKHHLVVEEKKKLEMELTSSKLELHNLKSDQCSGHVTDAVLPALPSINPLDMRLSPSKHIRPTTHLGSLSCSISQLTPMHSGISQLTPMNSRESHAPPAQPSVLVPGESIPGMTLSMGATELHQTSQNVSLVCRDSVMEVNEALAGVSHVTGSKGDTQLQYHPTASRATPSHVKQYTSSSASTCTSLPYHSSVVSSSNTEETLKPVRSSLIAGSSTVRYHMAKKQGSDHVATFQDGRRTPAYRSVGVLPSLPEDTSGYRNAMAYLNDHEGSYGVDRDESDAHSEVSIFKSTPQISLVDTSTQTLNMETKGVQTDTCEDSSDAASTICEHGELPHTMPASEGLRPGVVPHGTSTVTREVFHERAQELPHETEMLLHEKQTSKGVGGLLRVQSRRTVPERPAGEMINERQNSNGLLLERPAGEMRQNSNGLLLERPAGEMISERQTSNKARGLPAASGASTAHPGVTLLPRKSSLEERSSSHGIGSGEALTIDELSAPVSVRTAQCRNPYGIISGVYKSAGLPQTTVNTSRERSGVQSPAWDATFEPVDNADTLAVSALLNEQDCIGSAEDFLSCEGSMRSLEQRRCPEILHGSQCEADDHLSNDISPLQPEFTLNHTLDRDISCDSLGSEGNVLAAKWSSKQLNSCPPSRAQPLTHDKEQLQVQTGDDHKWNGERNRAFEVSSKVNCEGLHSQEVKEKLRQALKRGRSHSHEVDQLVESLFFLDEQN